LGNKNLRLTKIGFEKVFPYDFDFLCTKKRREERNVVHKDTLKVHRVETEKDQNQ
jgi:hypothetical protein